MPGKNLPSGTVVSLNSKQYRILDYLGEGGSGKAYKARVVSGRGEPRTASSSTVAIKIAKLGSNLTELEKAARLGELFAKVLAEAGAAGLLRDVRSVAHILDYGMCAIGSAKRKSGHLAVVQEYINGKPLGKYLRGRKKRFTGVNSASDFFLWARALTKIIRDVHRHQVIHGDIWQSNFVVDKKGNPILIDFGQSAMRKEAPFDWERRHKGSWMPPEGGGTVCADLFSLGGLLLFLAAGEGADGYNEHHPTGDIDDVKSQVVTRVEQANPHILSENAGIADIIARCLRSQPHQRPRDAGSLLDDIELFDERGADDENETSVLTRRLKTLKKKQRLLAALISPTLRHLHGQLIDLNRGVLDLNGDHEELVYGLTRVLSLLGAGDEYLTITVPRFWHAGNLGTQGRFLSMNRIAAQRGVRIRRLFLVTASDIAEDAELRAVMSAQESLSRSVSAMRRLQPEIGTVETYFREVTPEDRRRQVEGGHNCGVLAHAREKIVLSVRYSETGAVVSVEFRTDHNLARKLRKEFDEAVPFSQPIGEFSKWADNVRQGGSKSTPVTESPKGHTGGKRRSDTKP